MTAPLRVLKRPMDADWILAGARTWRDLQRCDVGLEGWLAFKLSCSPSHARKAAEWARGELARLGESAERVHS